MVENVWPHSLHETSITLNRCIRDDPLAPTPPSKLSSTPLSNPTHSSHRDHHPQRTPDNNKRPSSSSSSTSSVPKDPRLIGHAIFEQSTQKITLESLSDIFAHLSSGGFVWAVKAELEVYPGLAPTFIRGCSVSSLKDGGNNQGTNIW